MNERIMVVDDEPLITKTLETFLKFSFEGEILSSNDPAGALKIVEETMPDMIISDFMMPQMNGLEFLKQAKAICPDAVTILLTGYADKENAIRCINEVGLYYYAEKPWDNAMLLKIIENGLEKSRLQCQLKKKIIELEESNGEIGRLYSLLKKDFDQEVDNLQNLMITLANLIESKDKYTDGHTRRVAEICKLLGEKMGLEPKKIRNLQLAGVVHDIGKVGISEEILNKPGKLTPEEFEEMKKHTILGHHICLPLNVLRGCLDPIRHHHEKLNGSGYPDGLKGSQISLESRILAVADIFDALSSKRSYRDKMDVEKVKAILLEEAQGGLIDEEIVKILIELVDTNQLEELFNGQYVC